MRILLVNGPNINMLGRRDPTLYGSTTLAEIEAAAAARGAEMGAEVVCFQSNHEGAIVDFLQAEGSGSDGIILNGGALSHYGLSLRDALVDTGLPVVGGAPVEHTRPGAMAQSLGDGGSRKGIDSRAGMARLPLCGRLPGRNAQRGRWRMKTRLERLRDKFDCPGIGRLFRLIPGEPAVPVRLCGLGGVPAHQPGRRRVGHGLSLHGAGGAAGAGLPRRPHQRRPGLAAGALQGAGR